MRFVATDERNIFDWEGIVRLRVLDVTARADRDAVDVSEIIHVVGGNLRPANPKTIARLRLAGPRA